jgi:BirA family biotin operon repressor/biotin-[acetyl-CoA-carboxylase] ligase
VVVGLGLNTRLAGAGTSDIDQPWVDLESIPGLAGYSRNRLAAMLAARLIGAMARYGTEGLAPFLPQWERYDLFRGERVEIRLGDRTAEGIHAGVDDQGALRLERNGIIETFQAGEVSLRPAPAVI